MKLTTAVGWAQLAAWAVTFTNRKAPSKMATTGTATRSVRLSDNIATSFLGSYFVTVLNLRDRVVAIVGRYKLSKHNPVRAKKISGVSRWEESRSTLTVCSFPWGEPPRLGPADDAREFL